MNADGSVERYKVCLIVKGYNQREGFNYHETFSPIAKQSTVRVVIAFVATQGWYLSQLDINNAFLNRDLEKNVYEAALRFFCQGGVSTLYSISV